MRGGHSQVPICERCGKEFEADAGPGEEPLVNVFLDPLVEAALVPFTMLSQEEVFASDF
jgi:hypothetical protein